MNLFDGREIKVDIILATLYNRRPWVFSQLDVFYAVAAVDGQAKIVSPMGVVAGDDGPDLVNGGFVAR